jgi:hypothetical protein
MEILEQHVSPDGQLRLIVTRDMNGDTSLGFDGFTWHTHGDILSRIQGVPEDAAVRQFITDLLDGRSTIAISRVGQTIQDVWITDDVQSELKYKPADEVIEFRNWRGTTRSNEISP